MPQRVRILCPQCAINLITDTELLSTTRQNLLCTNCGAIVLMVALPPMNLDPMGGRPEVADYYGIYLPVEGSEEDIERDRAEAPKKRHTKKWRVIYKDKVGNDEDNLRQPTTDRETKKNL